MSFFTYWANRKQKMENKKYLRELERKEWEERIKAEKEAKERLEAAKRDEYNNQLRKTRDYLLPISVSDYVRSIGRTEADYEKRTIDHWVRAYDTAETLQSCKFGLVKIAENLKAEVVVCITPSISISGSYTLYYMMGTALIPKTAEPTK
jgi:hypothetical protein